MAAETIPPGIAFCSRECKNKAQSLTGKCKIIRPAHYGLGNGKYDYRIRALKKYGSVCSSCNYDEHKELLHVHHIDLNRDNNKLNNLIVLCPTCHWAVTLKLAKIENRKWIWL